VAVRLDSAPVPYWTLPRDSTATHYRHVIVRGTPDFDHEFYYVDRSHQGSPGVFVLTPVHVPGQDTAVLVNRGWVYAPDASTIEPWRWHAPDTLFVGYVEEFQPRAAFPPDEPHHLRSIEYAAIAPQLPYPLAKTFVVGLGNDSAIYGQPLRLLPPELDEGPHRSYAIQWFAFAVIALAGASFIVLKEREAARASTQHREEMA
jgi:surfeit locus 1 family protein